MDFVGERAADESARQQWILTPCGRENAFGGADDDAYVEVAPRAGSKGPDGDGRRRGSDGLRQRLDPNRDRIDNSRRTGRRCDSVHDTKFAADSGQCVDVCRRRIVKAGRPDGEVAVEQCDEVIG